MTSNNTLFKDGTKLNLVYTILLDQEWHCGKHELPGTQPAKAIQIIRQNGFDVENKTIYCPVCDEKVVHRRLVSLEPIQNSFVRFPLPKKLRQRIISYYQNIEAITLRKLEQNRLEVDHRFPQVRWSQDEVLDPNMTDEEIQNRFQLLTRENNLWKSRYCERCKATGERGKFIDIEFFAVGDSIWDPNIPENDERGCYGCFWYDPAAWRSALNALLDNTKDRLLDS